MNQSTPFNLATQANKEYIHCIRLHLSKQRLVSPTWLPRWLSGKEPTCQNRGLRRHRFDPWAGKISWKRKGQPTPVFLPGISQRQRSLVGYSSWGHRELDMTEHTHTHTHRASTQESPGLFNVKTQECFQLLYNIILHILI